MEFTVYNPLTETLVHPASTVVKRAEPSFVAKLTLRLQGLGKRKEDELFTFHSKLPPEIWIIILTIALAPVLRMHELANSETIPTTTRVMLRHGSHVLKYDDWPRLRLVCRMFHVLLGPNRYQGIRGSEDDRSLPFGVEALSMAIRDEAMNTFVALQNPTVLSRIRIFDITLMARTDGGGIVQDIIDELVVLAPSLPSLRSLSLYSSGRVPNILREDAWQQIAEGFPLLEDLCLWANRPSQSSKPAVLKSVKTLRTCDMPSTDTIRFPSLVHVWTYRWNPDGPFEALHAHKLVSLAACHPNIGIDQRILHFLPNAWHLGAPISSLAEIETPSSGHPINHLSVVVEDGATVGATLHREIPRLVQKLKQISSVTQLSFGREDGLPPAEMTYVLDSLKETNVTSIFTEC